MRKNKMQYRTLGKTGLKVSILGFGCMRLPTLSWETHNVNRDEAIKIIRQGIDAGINYVDTLKDIMKDKVNHYWVKHFRTAIEKK
jgi:predicted aldo/keto reductase-like oxidoreductase